MERADVVDPRPSAGGGKSTKQAWLNLAIETLVSDGIDQVKVQAMAKTLGVSRSSFYWFFDSIQDLQQQLLSHWLTRNTGPIIERSMRPASTIIMAVCNVFECWVDKSLFDPKLDIAIRFWARRDQAIRAIVEQADGQRVEAIKSMFLRHDYSAEQALIRARVLYFTQIGHYTLEVSETLAGRLAHLQTYLTVFTGRELNPAEIADFERFCAWVNEE